MNRYRFLYHSALMAKMQIVSTVLFVQVAATRESTPMDLEHSPMVK